MGRDKRNEARHEHFAQMLRATLETPAWRALSPVAQALYPFLKLQWRGARANNNGKLRLSVRQAGECIGCNPKTAARAFHALQAKGFLVCTRPASLGLDGVARCPEFELTEIALPGERSGRKLFENWRAGGDYPVSKAAIHNRKGANGKMAGDVIDLKARRR